MARTTAILHVLAASNWSCSAACPGPFGLRAVRLKRCLQEYLANYLVPNAERRYGPGYVEKLAGKHAPVTGKMFHLQSIWAGRSDVVDDHFGVFRPRSGQPPVNH
jgi:hypothetical protein